CASGCDQRTDFRRGKVTRRLAGDDSQVNEEWNCDKGRWAFRYATQPDRLLNPMVRNEDGRLVETSWPAALEYAATGLREAIDRGGVGVLPGGRLPEEDAYAYAKFARVVLGTNDVDARVRPISEEEDAFLAAVVAGTTPQHVSYETLDTAPAVLLVGFEPEDESPIVFLRLRKAVRKHKARVYTVAPLLSEGSRKLGATLVPAAQGDEAGALDRLDLELDASSVILVGERAATSAGTLSAVARLAERTGARLAWIPRRAGEVGAIDAGCLPTVLPGGRPVSLAEARVDVSTMWDGVQLPTEAGLDTDGMLRAAASGSLKALVVAGVQADDLSDPDAALAAFEEVGFLVSFEQRLSAVAERADVVFPVPLVEEQNGTFVDWEHRPRPVNVVNRSNTAPMTETRILAALADALDSSLGVRTNGQALGELHEFGPWAGERFAVPRAAAAPATTGLRLATWRELIDRSAGVDGSGALIATARPAVVRMSPVTAATHGLVPGALAEVGVNSVTVTVPVEVVDGMVDEVVWLPSRSISLDVTVPVARAGHADVTLTAASPVGGQE
ncbi:MAG TPA: molybdopterin-dependent oxidoreductase, partial [Propionibacteriaceae bacterium]|nr:molybdopterin-dependent oxidoreductase [Propionibacteriaceae bacterium]